MDLSDRARAYLSRPDVPVTPWSAEELHALEAAEGPLPGVLAPLEQALFEATGGRGLPVIGSWGMGAVRARAGGRWPAARQTPSGKRTVLFALRGPASGDGALYLLPSGQVDDERGWIVAEDVVAAVEREILLAASPWWPVRAVPCDGDLERAAKRAGCAKDAASSDAGVDMWIGNGLCVMVPGEARFVDLPAAGRFLEACARTSTAVRLVSDAPRDVEDGDDDAASGPLERRADLVVRRDSTRILARDAGALLQVTARAGRVLLEERFTAARTHVLRRAAAARFVASWASPRLMAFLDALGFFRDPSAAAGEDALAHALDERGLPFFDAWFALEEAAGGITWERPGASEPDLVLGLWPFLTASEDDRAAWDVPSDHLTPGPWPTARLGERTLVRAGAERGYDQALFAGEEGEIYRLVLELDKLTLEADGVRTFLEKRAAEWEMRASIEEHAPVTVGTSSIEPLVATFGLAEVPEASDRVSAVLRSPSLWVWRVPEYGLNKARTVLVGRSARDVVRAVTALLGVAPGAAVHVRWDLPGGKARIEALRQVGVQARDG